MEVARLHQQANEFAQQMANRGGGGGGLHYGGGAPTQPQQRRIDQGALDQAQILNQSLISRGVDPETAFYQSGLYQYGFKPPTVTKPSPEYTDYHVGNEVVRIDNKTGKSSVLYTGKTPPAKPDPTEVLKSDQGNYLVNKVSGQAQPIKFPQPETTQPESPGLLSRAWDWMTGGPSIDSSPFTYNPPLPSLQDSLLGYTSPSITSTQSEPIPSGSLIFRGPDSETFPGIQTPQGGSTNFIFDPSSGTIKPQ